jgi:hypothetical protein
VEGALPLVMQPPQPALAWPLVAMASPTLLRYGLRDGPGVS